MIFNSCELPVTGLVSAQRLVGREGFVANTTLVTERQGWRRGRRRVVAELGGNIAAASLSEHDEAESQILFFSRRVVEARTLGPLPLGPWLKVVEVRVMVELYRGGCSG